MLRARKLSGILSVVALSAGTIAFDSANGWTTGENPPQIAVTLPNDGTVQVGDWFCMFYGTSSILAGATQAPWMQITSDMVLNNTIGFSYNWGVFQLPVGLTYFGAQFGRGADAAHITLTSPMSNIINDTLANNNTNLVQNGTFSDTSVWTIGGPNGSTSISGGVLNCNPGNSGMCSQPVTYVNGGSYKVDFDYTCTSGAKLRINTSTTNGAAVVATSATLTTDGASHHITLTWTSAVGAANFTLEADSALFTGTIDNIVLLRTA